MHALVGSDERVVGWESRLDIAARERARAAIGRVGRPIGLLGRHGQIPNRSRSRGGRKAGQQQAAGQQSSFFQVFNPGTEADNAKIHSLRRTIRVTNNTLEPPKILGEQGPPPAAKQTTKVVKPTVVVPAQGAPEGRQRIPPPEETVSRTGNLNRAHALSG